MLVPSVQCWGPDMVLSTLNPWANPGEAILPAVVNWSQGYRVSYEFRTDVIVSEVGTEQRRAVRREPRQTIEFDSIWAGEARRDFEMFLYSRGGGNLVLADPLDVAVSYSGMAAGSFNIGVSRRPDWLRSGVEVVLWQRDGQMETRTVANDTGLGLSFSESSGAVWKPGVMIGRAVRGRLQPGLSNRMHTNTVGDGAVTFECLVGENAMLVPTSPGFDDIVGPREFFKRRPNWAELSDISFESNTDDVDYGYGRRSRFPVKRSPQRVYKQTYVGRDPDDVFDTVSFFLRHRGRRNEFLMSTWQDDIPFNFAIGGTNILSIVGRKYGLIYKDSLVFRRLIFRMRDGRLIHTLIDNMFPGSELSDITNIALADYLPAEPFTSATVDGVSWGLAARMATDRLDIDWVTDRVAKYGLSFQTLENAE